MIDIVTYKAAHSNYPKAISLSLQTYCSVRYVLKSKKFIGFKPLPFLCLLSSLLLQYLLYTGHKAVSPATFSSFKLDDALCLMWRAHVASIAYALPKFQDRYGDKRLGQGGSSHLHASLEDSIPKKSTRSFVL